MAVEKIIAFRVVAKNVDEYLKTVDFYRTVLGKKESVAFGKSADTHQASFFQIGGFQLVVTREEEVTPEAKIEQGPAWLCLQTNTPEFDYDEVKKQLSTRNDGVVNTSFGTKGFFLNDPTGLAVYCGTPWAMPPSV